MRTLSRIFTLILCLELIVGPIQPELSFLGTKAYAQQDCGAGMQFDSTLNRCLTTAQTANLLNKTTQLCAQGDKECYKRVANDELQKKVDAGEAEGLQNKDNFISKIGGMAATAGAVTYAILGFSKANSHCKSKAYWGMIGGGVTAFVGDMMANKGHNGRIKDIKEEWGKIVNPEQAKGDADKEREASLEAQSKAFEKLAEAEESLATAASFKEKIFYAAAAMYGVTAIMSTMEIFKEKSLNATAKAKRAAAAAPGPDQAARVTAAELAEAEHAKYKIENTCQNKPATSHVEPKKSIFEYYVKHNQINPKYELQYLHNLRHSKDVVSFVMNQSEMEGSLTSPIEEYEEYKKTLAANEIEDKTVFQLFKEISIAVITNLNPVPNAMARAEADQRLADDSENSSGGGGSNSSGDKKDDGEVDTKAAEAFREYDKKGINWGGLAVSAGVGFAASRFVGDKLVTSTGRLIFSGVMAGLTVMMARHAGSQADASKKRAELLRKMQEEFNTASGTVYACKSEDRNDPGKPTCYCYTPENQRNPNRGSSQVCQKLWAGKSFNATNYLAGTGTTSRICVSNQNKPDPTCACKQTKTCMKVGVGGISGLNPGTMSVLSSALAPINGLANGSSDLANVNAGDLANQASRIRDMNDKLANSKGLKASKKARDKAAKKLQSDLTVAGSNLGSSGLMGSSSSSGLPSNPGEAARMLEKELESNVPISIGGGGNTLAGPSNQAPEENFEFGLTPDQLAAQEGQIAELMKEDLDYGGNDINQGSNTNLFEVLSNRYQRSGMRRLFDEEGKTKADKAAKTDIVQ